jgi:hypothetical protein
MTLRLTPLTAQDSKISLLQLPDEIDGPVNEWFSRLLAAPTYVAAREIRDGGLGFAEGLFQKGMIRRTEADLIRLTFDTQWHMRIAALDLQVVQTK